MKTSIDYLPVRLKRRLGSTQNESKANPAWITTQISIWDGILISFKPHFGSKFLPETEFGAPLHEDNVSDIIIAL